MKTKSILGVALSLLMSASLTTPVQAANQDWTLVDGKWTYRNEEGLLATGWQFIDGCWYTFADDGLMKTGWIASDEKWYFIGESGVMQDTGWVSYEGVDYYLKGTGVMATDYIKDGYELDSTGKAIPMTQTKSVELTEQMDINNKIIEGNLYIDATKFKELELDGITVTGKLAIIGEEAKDTRITIINSTINTISSQVRGAEMTLAGATSVTNIQIEENSVIKPADDFTGKVETIEIQSTAQQEVKIEVPAKSVTSNTFAPVSINAPVDNLAVNKKTKLQVNANIENITVNNTATDTKVEVGKGSTVGSIESETKVDIGGAGKVEEIKGDDITSDIKPPKPSDDDKPTPPVTPTGVGVSTEAELNTKLADSTVTEIYLKSSFELKAPIVIERPVILNGNGETITMPANTLASATYKSAVVVKVANDVTIKNLTVVTGYKSGWQGYYGIQVYNSTGVTLNNITSEGSDGGILINGAAATLTGTTDVSGNEYGGIEVSNGVGVSGASLTLGGTIENTSETYANPTLWTIGISEEIAGSMINGFDEVLHKGPNIQDGNNIKNHYYMTEKFSDAIVVKNIDELKKALTNLVKNTIVLSSDIEVAEGTEIRNIVKENLTFDLNGYTITGMETSSTGYSTTLDFFKSPISIQNGTISASEGVASTIYVRGQYSYPEVLYSMDINAMQLYNCTENGNSVKANSYTVVNISNSTLNANKGGCMEAAGGTINVNEGNVFHQTGYYNHNSTIGSASNDGILNLFEGTFTSENYGLYVFNSGGIINVSGGTFRADKAVLKADKSIGQYSTPSTINVNGGTFDGKIEIAEGAFLNITAGTFVNTGLDLDKFKTYVTEGSSVSVENGSYVVSVGTPASIEVIDLVNQSEDVLPLSDIEEPVDLIDQPEAILPWTNIEEPNKEDRITG